LELRETKLNGMTDIDFRRIASLFFALRLIGDAADPINDAVELADKLLDKLQENE
jgi:hypothetical protein